MSALRQEHQSFGDTHFFFANPASTVVKSNREPAKLVELVQLSKLTGITPKGVTLYLKLAKLVELVQLSKLTGITPKGVTLYLKPAKLNFFPAPRFYGRNILGAKRAIRRIIGRNIEFD